MNDAHAKIAAKTAAAQPAPVRLTRTFHAPRELVFKAWGSADHVKRWFAPKPVHHSAGEVEMRVGGPFELVMLGPDGVEHWVRGKFVEVSKFDRLMIDMIVEDGKGHALLRAFTELRFLRRARRHAARRRRRPIRSSTRSPP